MKRFLLMLPVLLFLLAGCTVDTPETTGPTVQQTTNETEAPTLPGLYAPDSAVELQTEGSVRAYLPGSGCSMVMMGDNPLLFFWDENGTTTLMRLTGENYYPEDSVRIAGNINPEDSNVFVTESWICYYDSQKNCVVFLNEKLQESRRISMPDDLTEGPVMRGDLSEAYYCTATELRALNMETGLSRLIRRHDGETVYIRSVCLNGSALECYIVDGLQSYTEFVSTENGQSLGEDEALLTLESWEDRIFLQRMDGIVTENLFGTSDGILQSFVPEKKGSNLYGLLSMNGVLEAYGDESEMTLAFYDLSTGHKTAQVRIDGLPYIVGITADPVNEAVWFSSYDYAADAQVMYRWELGLSEISGHTVYTTERFTRENLDTKGLKRCRKNADKLEKKYGVEIFLDQELLQPEDYDFEYEYQVKAFEESLAALEKALAQFPEGFLSMVAQVTDSGKLQIGLVRSMLNSTRNAPTDTVGLQYWLNGEAYIALTVGQSVEQSFYHELCHVLDTFVYIKTGVFDDWEKLNPKGFQYDGNYTDYQTRTDHSYVEGENQAFIDYYSMTFAKEDRARILEYAMTEGNETCFASEIMQNKLRQLCVGIREAFGWQQDSRSFPWEQYLKEPLVCVQ